MEAPEAYRSSPAHPELPIQLVSQVGYVEDAFEARAKLAAGFSIRLVQGGVEGHIRIMAIVVTQGAHDVGPDTGGIFVEDGIGICRNGKPRAGLHFRLQLPWAPARIPEISAECIVPSLIVF